MHYLESEDCVKVDTQLGGELPHHIGVVGGVDGHVVARGVLDVGPADVQLDVPAGTLPGLVC